MFDSSKASLDQLLAELDRIGLVIKIQPMFTTIVCPPRRGGPGLRPPVNVTYSCDLHYKHFGDVVFEAPIAHATILDAVKYAVNYVHTGDLDGEKMDNQLDPWEFMLAKCADCRVLLGKKRTYDEWVREICDEAVMSRQDVLDIGENFNIDVMWALDADPVDVGREIAAMMKTPDPLDQHDDQVDWSRAFC